MPFRHPLFLTFPLDKVYDIFIYANFCSRALLVWNRIESSEFTKQIVVFSLIIVFLLFSIISTRGDFIVYFGYSCLGSTGLSTNKHEAEYMSTFLITTHQCSYIFPFSYFTNLWNYREAHCKTCKIGKIFGNI